MKKFEKSFIMGLTRKGLKAMEELAKLEAQRGNPEYLETEYGEGGVRGGRSLKGSGAGESFRRQEGAGRERAGTGVAAMRCAFS